MSINTSQQIAKHFKEVYFGGNWTHSNLKQQLTDVTWIQATQQIHNLNTIATLTYHIHYYTLAITEVLKGHPLQAKDELSFNHPPIKSEKDWNTFLENTWKEAECFVDLINQLPDDKLDHFFMDKKYGIYYRNLHGLIEHSHYHLGQISLIKKIITA